MKNHNVNYWLENLDDTLTLKDICLPGIDCISEPELPPDCDQFQQNYERQINCYQALSEGIRFFDFSVLFREFEEKPEERGEDFFAGSFFTCQNDDLHVPLNDILDQIARFLTGRETLKLNKETIIICFSAFSGFETTHKEWFINLLEAKIGQWLLEKEVLGRRLLSEIPLGALRGKIIVLLKEEPGQRVYYPFGITRNVYKWGEELSIYNNSIVGSEQENEQILDFISFEQRDFLYQFTPENWCEIAEQKTTNFRNNPLFANNAHGQKVNIITVKWGVGLKELVIICNYVSVLGKGKGTLGQAPTTNKSYLIRSAAKMDSCLSLLPIATAVGQSFIVGFQQKKFYEPPRPVQSIRLIKHTIAQQKFTFQVQVANNKWRNFQLSEEGKEVMVSTAASGSPAEWTIEPYYKPILGKDGTMDRYERQEGFYLIINDAQKTCLCLEKTNQTAQPHLSLRAYTPCQEIKEMVWCFEEVIND